MKDFNVSLWIHSQRRIFLVVESLDPQVNFVHHDTFQYAHKHKRKNSKHNVEEEMEMESVQAKTDGGCIKILEGEKGINFT